MPNTHKGLDRDELDSVVLAPGLGLPNDRRWALRKGKSTGASKFDPNAPAWLHKENFLCAFTANEQLGHYVTRFDDATERLTIKRRHSGASGGNLNKRACRKGETEEVLLQAQLTDATGRGKVEDFFAGVSGDQSVSLVSAKSGLNHHFGNTARGFRHHPSGSIIHIVNTATVAALGAAAGITLSATRFRPNFVVTGLPAWSEFDWVGRKIRLGDVNDGAILEVISRTVRCDATKVDPVNGSGTEDFDVPELLRKHFPEHGPYLGVYARVVSGGQVRPGDAVVELEQPLLERCCARVTPESVRSILLTPRGCGITLVVTLLVLVAAVIFMGI